MRVKPEDFDRLGLERTPEAARRRIEAMEQLLEKSFTMPVINRKFGIDFLLGLVPVVGDVVAAAMGSWIVWEARNIGLPKWKLARMVGNVGLDLALGAVPLLGDAADFFFRSNTRNLKIVRKHLDKHHPKTVTIEGERIAPARDA
ncbi:MAG: DUF4112 domain-containing protein [Parasphingopyxis sp.]|nr:DUF4112 domain-containing protein [Sphingomonadales bacterium]